MIVYRHRQLGSLMLWTAGLAAGAIVVMLVVLAASNPAAVGPLTLIVALVLLAMFLFGSLTVEVHQDRVELWFGPGWFRRRYPFTDIVAVEAVRNPWYYGWGIRMIPGGWLFNVSGLDAVELRLENGRRYRIGTDEPERLLAAIEDARSMHR